jgi:respiratory burst oxidase
MIATAIVVGITLHAGNHLACDFPRVINSGPDQYQWVQPDFGLVKPTYTSLLTGIEGDFWIHCIRLLLLVIERY